MLTAARWRLKPDLFCDLRGVQPSLLGERFKGRFGVSAVLFDVIHGLRHAGVPLLHEHLHPGFRVLQGTQLSDGLSDLREACCLRAARCSVEHLQDCRLCHLSSPPIVLCGSRG